MKLLKNSENINKFIEDCSQWLKSHCQWIFDKLRFKARIRKFNMIAAKNPRTVFYSFIGCFTILFFATLISSFNQKDESNKSVESLRHISKSFDNLYSLEVERNQQLKLEKQLGFTISEIALETDSILNKDSLSHEDSVKLIKNYHILNKYNKLHNHEEN